MKINMEKLTAAHRNMVMEMSDYLSATDMFGAHVTCSTQHWFNHVVAHEIMKKNKLAVIDTLMFPDEVYISSEHEDRKVFFKKSTLSTYDSERFYTKAIVGYSSNDIGELITAFPTAGIKGGIGNVIYKKQN